MMDSSMLYEEKTIVYPGTRFLRKVLRNFQVLPQEGGRHTTKHIVTFFTFNIFIAIPITFGLLGFIYKSLQDGFTPDILECVSFYLDGTIYWMIVIILFWRSEKFNIFFSENEIYRFGLPRTIETRSKLYRQWSIFSWLSINLVGMGRGIATHITNCPKENDEINLVCKVGFPAWFPFEIQNIYITSFIQITAGMCIIALGNVLASYSLILENTMFIAARIRHLENIMSKTRFQKDADADLKKLQFCIRYLMEIRKLILHMNDTIGYLLFPEFTLLIVSLSTLEYKIVFERDLMSVFLLVGWLSGPILHCEMGHILNEEYEKLRWAVYGMNWYAMKPELRKTFLLLLGSVQRPINFLVPPLFCLNRECLLRVIKGSYTFLMYLNSLSDKK